MRVAEEWLPRQPRQHPRLESRICLNDAMMVLNKPSGMAVHGGSGLSLASSEGLRAHRPEARFLELVHQAGSRHLRRAAGCCQEAQCLRSLHEQLRVRPLRKRYQRWCAAVATHVKGGQCATSP